MFLRAYQTTDKRDLLIPLVSENLEKVFIIPVRRMQVSGGAFEDCDSFGEFYIGFIEVFLLKKCNKRKHQLSEIYNSLLRSYNFQSNLKNILFTVLRTYDT